MGYSFNTHLASKATEVATGGVLWKKMFLKFRKIHSQTLELESLF